MSGQDRIGLLEWSGIGNAGIGFEGRGMERIGLLEWPGSALIGSERL
jgi:hypothetical protein